MDDLTICVELTGNDKLILIPEKDDPRKFKLVPIDVTSYGSYELMTLLIKDKENNIIYETKLSGSVRTSKLRLKAKLDKPALEEDHTCGS